MKTQISRHTFRAEKRYAGVYQQQGRMVTDADWNSLVDILKGHLAEALEDVVGDGAPRTGALTITNGRLIQPGDLYVGGLRAALPGTAPIDAAAQPDFPGSPNLPATGPYIVYADVWERSLTALEDLENPDGPDPREDLRDPGLNGADTCTRTQTMLQVKVCPESVDPENDIPQTGNAVLTLTLHSDQESGDPCDPCAGQVEAAEGHIGNYLFRLEVHAVRWKGNQLSGLTLKWSSENGAEQYEAREEALMPPGFVVSGRYAYEFFDQMSETHSGVHLNPDAAFEPASGELTPAYAIPDGETAPKNYVRRWDGYCELIHDGAGWSLAQGVDKGVDLSTSVQVGLKSMLSLNLEAMKLDLLLTGKRFVPGDYWLAPVREAIHGPGSKVLDGAAPEGIVHHFLRLARIAADGGVQLYDDDADRRRHSFPPLTDLWASDVDYRADCDTGKGLFQNFVGNVQEALDKICEIGAGDVGFAKPCDTSIYQGKAVSTVEDALKLLCDVQADQIAYQPNGCTDLNPSIGTVQDALDALCTRPAGGGCKVTVGIGGQYDTVDNAIKSLLDQQFFDICLCLLPGEHGIARSWINEVDRFNLSITGCGAGAKVILEKPLAFTGLTSLKLEDFAIDAMRPDLPITVERCTQVDIRNLHHMGLTLKKPLIQVTGGEQVRLEENILEAYTVIGLKKPQRVFAFNPGLEQLYTVPLRNDFLVQARQGAEELSQLHQNERLKIAGDIQSNLEKLKLPPDNIQFSNSEEVAYRRLSEVLAFQSIEAPVLLDRLRDVRDQAHHATAGIGVVFIDALANVAIGNNTVFGSIGFYGPADENDLSSSHLDALKEILTPPTPVRSQSYAASVKAWDNRITRLTVGAGMVEVLRKVIDAPNQNSLVQGLYGTALFESNIIAGSRNQLMFENLTLSANEFQTLTEPRIGWAFNRTAIFSGNRVQRAIYADLKGQEFTVGGGAMQNVAAESAKAANLPKGSW